MSMCDLLVQLFNATNWLEVIKALAPVATAVIAFAALRNWQRQDKAKSEAEFLDALIEAVHAYIAEISAPVSLVEFSKIGMESHAPTWESGEQEEKALKGAMAFIQKNGKDEAKRFAEMLRTVKPLVVKLKSLATKGQVFHFDDYAKCRNAILMLTWQFDRIQGFTSIIGMPTLNWENPQVLKTLENVMALDPNDIRTKLEESNIAIIEFARTTYKRIYG